MDEAQKSLIFALDVPDLGLAETWISVLRGKVGIFKIGLELWAAYGPEILKSIADPEIEVMLDLKLHDIPTTVGRTIDRINQFDVVKYVTVHAGDDSSGLEFAVMAARSDLKILAISVLTTVPPSEAISRLVTLRAESARNAGCHGLVCSGLEVESLKPLVGELQLFTPGIRLCHNNDDQKRVTTPFQAISRGANKIVVGRPIRNANDPIAIVGIILDQIKDALND